MKPDYGRAPVWSGEAAVWIGCDSFARPLRAEPTMR